MKLYALASIVFLLVSQTGFAEPLDLNLNRPIFGERNTGFLTTPCEIENKTVDCFIDTGARGSFVSKVEFSHLTKVGEDEGGGAHGTIEKVDLVEVSSFQMGPIVAEGHTFRRATGSGFISEKNLIGNDFLKSRVLYFDFDQETLSIDEYYPSVDEELELLQIGDHWFGMPVKIGNGLSTKALWDTGASITVVSKNLVQRNTDNFEFVGHIDTVDANGESLNLRLLQTDLEIGGRVFPGAQVVEMPFEFIQEKVDPEVEVIVGFNVYTKANWLMDCKSMLWGFVD